jgi:hypothetical protein
MRDVGPASKLLAGTASLLAGDRLHLRRLQVSLQRTGAVIRQASYAYLESRKLLDHIDGAPYEPLLGDFHIPE